MIINNYNYSENYQEKEEGVRRVLTRCLILFERESRKPSLKSQMYVGIRMLG